MPFSAARRIVSRREHATHSGGCGFCSGLGTTLRGGIVTKRPSTPANGSSTIIRVTTSSASSHCSRFVSRSTPKPAELGARRRLPRAELDAAAGDEVERRDASRRRARGAGSRAAAAGSRSRAGCRFVRCEHAARKTSDAERVRVLLEEVVLDLPDVVEAERGRRARPGRARPGGAGARRPSSHGRGQLVLVEDPEAHRPRS